MDEGLGKIHFWLTFIAMNLTFFPMHFSGMLGMPRRIYTPYDAGQGWERLCNSCIRVGAMIFVRRWYLHLQFLRQQKARRDRRPESMGRRNAGVDDSQPPPEYNFAKIPTVTSRYPIWEGKEVDHGERAHQLARGKDRGRSRYHPARTTRSSPSIVAFGFGTNVLRAAHDPRAHLHRRGGDGRRCTGGYSAPSSRSTTSQ